MSTLPFHVLIIGAGTGGLCLAQGLKQANISFAVYERDRTRMGGLQGYCVGRVRDLQVSGLLLHS